MILYDGGKYGLHLIFHAAGSVIPNAALVALGPTIFSAILNILYYPYGTDIEPDNDWIPTDNEVSIYNMFNWVLGFVLVFRTGQAYSRYWEGATLMHTVTTEWYDSCAQITAFTANGSKSKDEIENFNVL